MAHGRTRIRHEGCLPVRVEVRTSRGLRGVIGRRSGVGGKDREGAAAKWCDRTDVALVESQDPSRAVTRGQDDHGAVDQAKLEVGVPVLEVSDRRIVAEFEAGDGEAS